MSPAGQAFTRVGKQIMANGYHYADAADDRAAEHLLACLTRAPAAPVGDGWLPIESAPKDGTAVLLFYGKMSWEHMGELQTHVERCDCGWFSGGEWYEGGTGHEVFEDWRTPDQLPTHWRPLPAAPEQSA